MFRYFLKLAVISIRKNAVLSALMVAAIAVGIGACMTVVNIHHVMSGNPIPQKSDQLFYVRLDNWDPNVPYDDTDNWPPDQVTYLDATALLEAGKARRQVVSFRTSLVVEPEDEGARPFEVSGRATTKDFFAMFDVPFVYGGGWGGDADAAGERVVVLSRRTNDRLFGGGDSTGRRMLMNGSSYRIVGVLDEWEPVPRFYDVTIGAFGDTEEVFVPFRHAVDEGLSQDGNTNCWKPVPDGGRQAFLNSECIWMQMWVELHGDAERDAYLDYLDAYVMSQKELGRFPRPLNNRLTDIMTHLEVEEVVDESVGILLTLAALFLIVCLLNTIGLLLAKVTRRTGDISLRRALGASRQAIVAQYFTEAAVIGLSGGLLGVGLTWLGLYGIRGLYAGFSFIDQLVRMDWQVITMALALAVFSAIIAALYPTLRAVQVHPASELKSL